MHKRLRDSKRGGNSASLSVSARVPRVIPRVIFALFLRYFALFLRHPVRFHDGLDRASATWRPALATTFELGTAVVVPSRYVLRCVRRPRST